MNFFQLIIFPYSYFVNFLLKTKPKKIIQNIFLVFLFFFLKALIKSSGCLNYWLQLQPYRFHVQIWSFWLFWFQIHKFDTTNFKVQHKIWYQHIQSDTILPCNWDFSIKSYCLKIFWFHLVCIYNNFAQYKFPFHHNIIWQCFLFRNS